MKVSDSLNNSSGLAGLPVKDDTKLRVDRSTEFRSQLTKVENSNYMQHLESLVKNIVNQGDTLAKRIQSRWIT